MVVPLAVQRARELLEKAGVPITKENMEKYLPKDEMNKLGSTLRTALKNEDSGQALSQYQGSKGGAKKDSLVEFVLDPDVSKLTAVNENKKINKDSEMGTRIWLTLAQMASSCLLRGRGRCAGHRGGGPS